MGQPARMPSRRWMWVRPTPHIYAYNRELSAYGGTSSSASASATSETSRSLRASSEAAFDRVASSRIARAPSLAPEPGTSLAGSTGSYGRQLSLLKEADAVKRAAAASTSRASAAAASASSAASKSVSASMKSTSVQQTV